MYQLELNPEAHGYCSLPPLGGLHRLTLHISGAEWGQMVVTQTSPYVLFTNICFWKNLLDVEI